MSARQILVGGAAGTALWFFAAVYFAILVQAAVPDRAPALQELAAAALFPMALVSALVLMHQRRGRELVRFAAVFCGAGLVWFPAALLAGEALRAAIESPERLARLQPVLHLVLLVLAFPVARLAVHRWMADREPDPHAP